MRTKTAIPENLGFKDIPVRFFIYNEEADEGDEIEEVDESDFLSCNYPISYERNTIFDNGVHQICLTKIPLF
jgi:hypothetical protein